MVPAPRVSPADDDKCLNVVDGDLLAAGVATGVAVAVAVLVELEAAVAVLARAKGVGLVDLGGVGELAVGLAGGGLVMWGMKGSGRDGENVQGAGLIGRVLEDNVTLLVLVFAQRDQDDVAVVDPDLFPELAADQTEALDTVEALRVTLVLFFIIFLSGVAGDCTIASSLPFPSIFRTWAYS